MGLIATRVHGDETGETHLTRVEVPTEAIPALHGIARLEIPLTTLQYVEYPQEQAEIMPGFHCAPRRQFVLCVQGSFEVTATDGSSQVFRPGDWFLADDVDTKGHVTKAIGPTARVNVVLGLDPDWSLPG
jgi:hypothetical protein